MKIVNVLSGELKFSGNGDVLQTVLGSCVAVCIFDRTRKIGAMAHYLLPKPMGIHLTENTDMKRTYFGSEVIPKMIDLFLEYDANKDDLDVSLFGAGDSKIITSFSVGKENIDIARKLFDQMGILIKNEKILSDVEEGMWVRFDTLSGEIYIKNRKAITKIN